MLVSARSAAAACCCSLLIVVVAFVLLLLMFCWSALLLCLLQSAVPVAAWLPHQRQAAAAAIHRRHGDLAVPVAVLALGWGSRLVLFEVPLLGDHVSLGGLELVTGSAAAAAAGDWC